MAIRRYDRRRRSKAPDRPRMEARRTQDARPFKPIYDDAGAPKPHRFDRARDPQQRARRNVALAKARGTRPSAGTKQPRPETATGLKPGSKRKVMPGSEPRAEKAQRIWP